MKLLAALFVLSSCSHYQYSVYYTADTMKKTSCEPQAYSDYASSNFINPGPDAAKITEEHTGYSECVFSNPDKETSLLVCKKPTLYKQITTRKQAVCNKFLVDNKLL
jgi:hypothetical protein